MTVRALILVPAIMLANAGQAADLRHAPPTMHHAREGAERHAAIVVPPCRES
ncbi:MAG: hypothetical protein JWR08_209 [Enterovirga sp.]|nr:hypothetical protein [Enterovirga sp.]